ncbi:hypothetical protein M5X11_14850 [Paenibacillus alginolyticus]|uniref:Uncharacterized protein n=1 Tax=Paenibacillus alginolyticus TaxID=59839 RepID=A0ABT4GFF1_9BACL|nr:hypothetical protein [Paenibacillus alginolyticus]MCY9666228.1 hypothetical protein [Paenibacillus alginolyticus]MCY9694920.1 hypothetical protein [Paenibacillus alginolyticus]MEC0143073.1 hypothetical protein [Paenibacillus alginolyticus]
MSFQEKRNVVSLFTTLLIFSVYSLYVFQKYQEGNFHTSNEFSFWGAFILILIPVSIVAKVIIHIVFSIINTVATKEKEPLITDELDKLIALKSTRNSHYVFIIGFLLSMISLVMDQPPYVMFIILISSGLLSEVVGIITQLYLYRKGV